MTINFYTLREAALRLGLAHDTLRSMIRRDQLTAIKPGHDWLVEEAEMQRLLEKYKHKRRKKTQG